jgi:simple sugar transport system permease protein
MIAALRSLLSGAILSGTPLLYATLAEIIGERAGVVNLGLEGVRLLDSRRRFAPDPQPGATVLASWATRVSCDIVPGS